MALALACRATPRATDRLSGHGRQRRQAVLTGDGPPRLDGHVRAHVAVAALRGYRPASDSASPVPASNRCARSRSTVTEQPLARRTGDGGSCLDLEGLRPHLDVDHRPVAERLEPVELTRQRRVSHAARRTGPPRAGRAAAARPSSARGPAGPRQRPAFRPDQPVALGVAGEQADRRAPDESCDPLVGGPLVDLGRRADLLHLPLAGGPRPGRPSTGPRPGRWSRRGRSRRGERWMRVSSVRISTRSLRSRFVSGSSMRNARGRRTSARASATRCISPPDICAGRRCSRRSMCSRLDTRSTAAAISLEDSGVPAAARRCSRTPCAAGRGRSSGRPSPGRARPGCRRSRRCRPGAPTRRRASRGRRSRAGSSSCPPRTGRARTKNDAVRHVERHPVEGLDVAERLAQPVRLPRFPSGHQLFRARVVDRRGPAGVAQPDRCVSGETDGRWHPHPYVALRRRGRPRR